MSNPINGAGHPGKKKISGSDLGRWLSRASTLTRSASLQPSRPANGC